jgi:hypothetical protein
MPLIPLIPQVIVLSIGQMLGLAEIEGYPTQLPQGDLTVASSEAWIPVMQFFYDKWKGPAVICCFKVLARSFIALRITPLRFTF